MVNSINNSSLQWKSYATMFVVSILVVGCALYVAHCFNKYFPLTKLWVSIFECAGYVFWGTALADPKVVTWSKCTPPEVLYRRLQIFCSEMGIFVFVLAQALVVPTSGPI
jgi:hypothetical protein